VRRFSNFRALAHYGFPFSFGAATTPVARLRALGFSSRFADRGLALRLALRTAMAMAWPIGALIDAARYARMLADDDDDAPFGRTLLDMYRLALAHNIPPIEYLYYRLHEPAHRADIHQYLYWSDGPALAALNARRGADNRAVQDKHRFAEICAQSALPHVETLAVFDGGVQVLPKEPFVPDRPRLFVKHLRGTAGMDAATWIEDGNEYRNEQGRSAAARSLAEILRRQDCIVQPLLRNHPIIAPLTDGRLATLRIVTAIDGADEAQFVWALLGLPFGGRVTLSLSCGLDENGMIVRASADLRSSVTSHPDGGASLVGFRPPFWHESVELVKRAHTTAFPRFFSLGWDIALTDTGPVLLEANSGWGALAQQVVEGPLGRTVLSRLISEQLSCA
jgi:hypothetical protein